MWPAPLDATYKRVHEGIVFFATNAIMPPSDIEWTIEPLLVVSSHIEQNRKTMLRMNPSECRVKRHLSDGNAHSSGALIAEPQDPLAVADHNAFHRVVTCVIQDLIDTIPVRITEEQAPWPSPNFAEALAPHAHCRRIH